MIKMNLGANRIIRDVLATMVLGFLLLFIHKLVSKRRERFYVDSDKNSNKSDNNSNEFVRNTTFFPIIDSLESNIGRKAEKTAIYSKIDEIKNTLGAKSDKVAIHSLLNDLEKELNSLELVTSKHVTKESIYPVIQDLKEKLKNVEKKCPPVPDMSKYILKSQIPAQKKCPPMPNMKEYVLKTSILPQRKCPDLICPKVKVSAGLCKKCPPPPKCPPCKRCPKVECPVPEPCPLPKCPEPKPCPPQKYCPKPQPCPKCPPRGICPRCPTPKCSKSSRFPFDQFHGLLDSPEYNKIQAMRSHSHIQL